MTEPARVLLGLGSNLGDRPGALAGALDRLSSTPGTELLAQSPVYETEPWGVADQPGFLNQVVEIATTLGPEQLLLHVQSIERALGRVRTMRWGPRQIDLDILDYDGQRIDRRGLQLPHPLIAQRAFVLQPLRDVRPDYRLPSGETIDQALAALRLG